MLLAAWGERWRMQGTPSAEVETMLITSCLCFSWPGRHQRTCPEPSASSSWFGPSGQASLVRVASEQATLLQFDNDLAEGAAVEMVERVGEGRQP